MLSRVVRLQADLVQLVQPPTLETGVIVEAGHLTERTGRRARPRANALSETLHVQPRAGPE